MPLWWKMLACFPLQFPVFWVNCEQLKVRALVVPWNHTAENCVQNLEVKKINDEKKTALAAQFAAEATLRRVHAAQKDEDLPPIEAILAPLEAELRLSYKEVQCLASFHGWRFTFIMNVPHEGFEDLWCSWWNGLSILETRFHFFPVSDICCHGR